MITKYVDNRELKRIIEDGSIKTFRIKRVLKEQGIVLISTNPEVIAKQVYPILWGCEDIYKFKTSMDDECNYVKSSLIELKCEVDESENLMDTIEDFFNNSNYNENKFTLSSITRLDDEKISMSLKYMVMRTGRNELLSGQQRSVDIFINKKGENKVIMDIRQASAFDLRDVNKFLIKAINKNKEVVVSHISLNRLTKENRISFFDKFNLNKFADWRFITVTKVELKKDKDDETREIDEEDGSEARTNLQGITNAILSGTSIRNNSFVQDCLQGQFSISTMGYKFENIKEQIEVVVEINFKYEDIKIDICKTYEYDADERRQRSHPITLKQQEDIIKMFQDAAYNIYNELLKSQKGEVE